MRKAVLSLSIVISLVMLACNLPFISVANQDNGLVATSVAKTVAALNAQQIVIPTQAIQIPTLAPAPTQTSAPVPTQYLPPTPTPLPCNKALPVSETYPDGTTLNINTTFNKSWRIRNAGTCTWNTNYKIKFYSGNAMNGLATMNFTQIIHPGETMDIIMPLKVPAIPGTYTGTWHLYGDDNLDFTQYGIWVTINAVNPAPIFAVTSVAMAVDANAFIGACPHTFHFTAGITTNTAGLVTYYWTRSDGPSSAQQSLTYASAGTQTVAYDWSLGAAGAYWVKLYINNPNHQYFTPVNITLTCT
jgi:hypothetical protein